MVGRTNYNPPPVGSRGTKSAVPGLRYLPQKMSNFATWNCHLIEPRQSGWFVNDGRHQSAVYQLRISLFNRLLHFSDDRLAKVHCFYKINSYTFHHCLLDLKCANKKRKTLINLVDV